MLKTVVLLVLIGLQLALAFNTGNETAGTWPQFAQSYSATVSMNFNSTGRGFYTMAFTESFDQDLQIYRAQGRFHSPYYVELFFLRSGVVFTFDERDPGNSCNFTAINLYSTAYSNYSIWSIERYGFAPNAIKTFMGNNSLPGSISVRNINYELWNLTLSNSQHERAASLYVRLDKSPEIVRVPLRLERKYSESINGVSYSVVETTDWTSFVMGKPAPLLFQYPPRCANSDPAALQQRIVLPAVSASAQSSLQIPPTTARIPTLPDQFTMTMEAKPHEDNDDDDESVSTVVWTLDVPNRKERLDVYSLLEEDEPDSPTIIHSYFYQYAPNTPWGTVGTVHTGYLGPNAAKFTNCVVSEINSQNQSPLLTTRAGSIPLVFADPTFLNSAIDSYIGTENFRGVTSNVYRFNHTLQHGSKSYKFSMEIGLYPTGWRFPGRQSAEAFSLPLHIRNKGTVVTKKADGSLGAPKGYTDNWDFFFFVPGAVPPARFDPRELGCDFVSPPTAAPAPADSTRTAVVAAALGALGGAVVATGIALYMWKLYRLNNPPPVKHQQLPTNEMAELPSSNGGTVVVSASDADGQSTV